MFLAQGDWARFARVSREDHRVAATPRALPSAIAVTCASRLPDERSRCGTLARQLPRLAPGLVRLTLDCGLRCRIHAAMRLARPALSGLAAFDLTLSGTSDDGCSLPSRLLPRDARSGETPEAEFRFEALPATVTDLRVSLSAETRLFRLGSIVTSLPCLVRLTLPTGSCGLFWRPRRHLATAAGWGRTRDDIVFDEEYRNEYDMARDNGERERDEKRGAVAADDDDDDDDMGADSKFPMTHLVELLVPHIDGPIRPAAFPSLRALVVVGDLWADALTSILLNVPCLVELRLGVDGDGGTNHSDAIVGRQSDLESDSVEEKGEVPRDDDWPPAVAAAKANAIIDANPPLCAATHNSASDVVATELQPRHATAGAAHRARPRVVACRDRQRRRRLDAFCCSPRRATRVARATVLSVQGCPRRRLSARRTARRSLGRRVLQSRDRTRRAARLVSPAVGVDVVAATAASRNIGICCDAGIHAAALSGSRPRSTRFPPTAARASLRDSARWRSATRTCVTWCCRAPTSVRVAYSRR